MTAEIDSSVPFDWMIVFDSILLHVAFQRLNVLRSDGRLYNRVGSTRAFE